MTAAAEGGELRDLALAVAREAASLVRRERAQGVVVTGTKSSIVDVVTETDRASENLLRRLILARRPEDAFLGEEGDDVSGSSGVRWIVDPIDGTVNFVYGLPEYAISVAAEVAGQVVAGAVVNAATGVEYAAARGHGATRDDQPIVCRPAAPLDQRLVLTGFGYAREARELQAAGVARLLPRVRDIRRMGSCALDLCHVAEGAADAYLEEGVNLWDFAAGRLIAEEAGARVEVGRSRWSGAAVVCTPDHGFDGFRTLLDEIAFFGE